MTRPARSFAPAPVSTERVEPCEDRRLDWRRENPPEPVDPYEPPPPPRVEVETPSMAYPVPVVRIHGSGEYEAQRAEDRRKIALMKRLCTADPNSKHYAPTGAEET